MAVDPNIYSLSIFLQLDATQAFETLDKFETAIIDLEEKVTDAAQAALGRMDDSITKATASLNTMASAINSINTQGTRLASTVASVGSDTFTMAGDTEEQVAHIKKSIEFWEEVRDLNEEIVKCGEEELERMEEYAKIIKGVEAAIKVKNIAHTDELRLVNDEHNLLLEAPNLVDQHGQSVRRTTRDTYRLSDAMRQVWNSVKALDADTENYITTNYRVYGSQQDILRQARVLTAEQGLFAREAVEAYKVLGDLGVPRDELDNYAKTVVKANRYLGVGISQLGAYAHHMRQAGMDSIAMERQVNFASEAMRKFGLSSQDVNRVLGDTSISAAELEFLFSGENQAEKYKDLSLVIAGLGKQAGFTADQTQNLMNQLMQTQNLMMLQDATSIQVNSVESFGMAVGKSGQMLEKYVRAVEAAEKAGNSFEIAEKRLELENFGKELGYTNTEQMMMAAQLSKVAREMNINLGTAEGYKKAMEELRRAGVDPFIESNNTLTAQLRLLGDGLMSIYYMLAGPFLDAIKEALKYINLIIQYVAIGIEKFSKFMKVLAGYIPFFEEFTHVLKVAGGAVLLLVGTVTSLGVALGLLRISLGAIQVGITGLFGAIGRGIAAFGNAIRGVMVPLLAFGATVLMVGAGVYALAKSVQMIAELGDQAAAAIIKVGGAVAALGATLLVFGTIANFIIPGLLTISATFLAVGASALMFGYGMKLGAVATQMFVSAIKELVEIDLSGFAYDLFSASGYLILASANLLLAGLAMVPAGAAIVAGSISLRIGLFTLSGVAERISEIGIAMYVGGTNLLHGVQAINIAAGLMREVSSVLRMAMAGLVESMEILTNSALIALDVLSSRILDAGGKLRVGANALLVGAVALGVAADVLYRHGVSINAASSLLLPAAVNLSHAGVYMISGAVAVAEAASIISLNSVSFLYSADILMQYAVAVVSVSTMLAPAAISLADSGILLRSFSRSMLVSAVILDVALETMSEASAKLQSVAMNLSYASAVLLPTSGKLYLGSIILQSAVSKFSNMSPIISKFSGSLAILTSSLLSLQGANLGTFGDIANAGLRDIPKIDSFSDSLSRSADKLAVSVAKFKTPADQLVATLGNMQSALAAVDLQGIAIESQVGEMGAELEKYAVAIESVAERVEGAIAAKALPAISDANAAGVGDIVRSEAITTVQVLDKREGGRTDEHKILATQQVVLMTKLVDLVASLVGDSQVTEIRDLLSNHLASAGDGGGLLSNEMNQWMK